MSYEHPLSMAPVSGLVAVRVRLEDAWEEAAVQELGPSGLRVALADSPCPQGRKLSLALVLRGFEDDCLRLVTDIVSVRRSRGLTLVSVRYREVVARADREVIVTFLTRLAGRLELDESAFSRTRKGWAYRIEDTGFGGTRPIVNRRSAPLRSAPRYDVDHADIQRPPEQGRRRTQHLEIELERPAAWATEHRDGQATVCATSRDGIILRLRADKPLPLSLQTIWVSICPSRQSDGQMRLRGTVLQTDKADSSFTVRLVPVGLAGHLDRWKAEVARLASQRVVLGATLIEAPTQPINS